MRARVPHAGLGAKEKRAIKMDIQRQLAEYHEKHLSEIDSVVLWVLHEEFGFGTSRLKKFHRLFSIRVRELLDRYEFTDEDDQIWIFTNKLKNYGVDLEEWNREVEKEVNANGDTAVRP